MAKQSKFRIGIDIGTNAVKVASYHYGKKKERLTQLMKYDFLQGDIVQNIEDVNETHIMTAVRDMVEELPFRRSSMRVGISADYHNVFSIQVPQVAKHELKQTLFWEMTPLLPDPIDNYEFDYSILPNTSRKRSNVLVAVLKKSKMEWLSKLFKSLSTDVDVLETTVLPAADLLLKGLGKLDEPIGFLQVGASHSHYMIIDAKSYPEFLYIPIGGNKLNKLIAGERDVPFLEAEYLRLGLMSQDDEEEEEGSEEEQGGSNVNLDIYMSNEKVGQALKELSISVKKMNLRHEYTTGQKVEKLFATGGLINDEFVH